MDPRIRRFALCMMPVLLPGLVLAMFVFTPVIAVEAVITWWGK